MPDEKRDSELVLPQGTFVYVLDQTKGNINTLTGPNKTTLNNTDQLVVFNSTTSRFDSSNASNAVRSNITAPKGHYVILTNPAVSGKQPRLNTSEILSVDGLKMGEIENISGPVSFPLWPGQTAVVVRGHHLRTNQYLLGRVTDDEVAQANWDKSVVKTVAADVVPVPAANTTDTPTDSEAKTNPEVVKTNPLGINKDTLVTGQLLVIKGTDVAFYIPPTGIEILQDEESKYIRDAVTLERLEYSILLGENGEKSYVIGPAVVFPTPTQQFYVKNNARKFRAFELQPTTGIHVKVIDSYTENGVDHKAGDEIFITGADTPIYFPKPEHAIIAYGGYEKSYAVAIPGGEGRYVLNRKDGNIDLIEGPAMFLPNPIKQVVVRRVLSRSECELCFPGNSEVLRINDELRGAVSEDSYGDGAEVLRGISLQSQGFGAESLHTRSFAPSAKTGIADSLNRGTQYQAPRTITLNSKYQGAVRIDVWSGFAVQVVNSKGDRRTVLGPRTVLLQYDEYLQQLSLSKGKPKNSDNRINTGFLRYISNSVSDIISLKTNDLVSVDVEVKYRVRFDENQKDRWFVIDNYVQYMVDHLRSLIGNSVRTLGVQELYSNAANIIRDIVLGKKEDENRAGREFVENGMKVYEVELISIVVKDAAIATLLANARQETLKDSIELDRQTGKLTLIQGQEKAKRQIAVELSSTQELVDELDLEQTQRKTEKTFEVVKAELESTRLRIQGELENNQINQQTAEIRLNIRKADNDLEQTYLEADLVRQVKLLSDEAQASKTRMEAVSPGLVEALVAVANAGILERVTPQIAALAFMNGSDTETVLTTLLKGTSAEGILANLKNLSKIRISGAGA